MDLFHEFADAAQRVDLFDYLYLCPGSVRSSVLTVFSRQYRIVPANEYDPQIQKIVRDLHLISRQEGWMPPESMPEQAAWPYFSTDEIMSVAAVLQSGKINQWTGSQVEIFQEEFADYCGVRHAIALANGSVALDLALLALDIGPGDEVIVTPRTFVASAACVVLRGANRFCRCGSDSQNITAESIAGASRPDAGDYCSSPCRMAVRHGPDPGNCEGA